MKRNTSDGKTNISSVRQKSEDNEKKKVSENKNKSVSISRNKKGFVRNKND